jgi:hypothetical protein
MLLNPVLGKIISEDQLSLILLIVPSTNTSRQSLQSINGIYSRIFDFEVGQKGRSALFPNSVLVGQTTPYQTAAKELHSFRQKEVIEDGRQVVAWKEVQSLLMLIM